MDAHQAGVLIATAIDTGEPALQTASVGEIIERATFDPEWAQDNPDLTLPDLGHPLVRRLIEEVKQHAFSPVETFRRNVSTPERLHRRIANIVTPNGIGGSFGDAVKRRCQELEAERHGTECAKFPPSRLTCDKLGYIAATSPIVRRKDAARWGEYRTRRIVLEEHEKLEGRFG